MLFITFEWAARPCSHSSFTLSTKCIHCEFHSLPYCYSNRLICTNEWTRLRSTLAPIYLRITSRLVRTNTSHQNEHMWIWLATERTESATFRWQIWYFVGEFSGAAYHKHAKLLLNHCSHSLPGFSSTSETSDMQTEPHAHRTYANENASVAEQQMQSNANKTRKMPTTPWQQLRDGAHRNSK